MKLLLASQIKHELSIKALLDFLGEDVENELVYIPTASNAEIGFEKWKEGGTFKAISNVFKNIKILELEFTKTEECIETIKNAKMIFMAGGMPVYLMYWLKLRKIDQIIVDKVKSNELKYIGSSAGSLVCCKSLNVASILDNDPFSKIVPGLGLLDFEICPHYDESIEKEIQSIENEFNIDVKRLRDGEVIILN